MAVEFSCPYCQQLVRTPLSAAGKKGKCPQCKAVVQIPAAQAAKEDNCAHLTPSRVAQGIPAADASKIEFYCVECGQLVRTPAAVAGKKGKCPNCRALIAIPQKSAKTSHGSSLVELTPLEPLTAIGPLPPPPAVPPPLLAPLLDEALPPLAPEQTLPSLPATEWQGNPYWSGRSVPAEPAKKRLTDLGRRGLPWERDPSTESYFETVRYVLTAPGDAFLTMYRTGIGSPFGFLLVGSVFSNLVNVILWTALAFVVQLVFIMVAGQGQSIVIKWDALFLGVAWRCCLGIGAGLVTGTIGGLLWAAIYHVCVLMCGAGNAGFATTYRVVAFTTGSTQMLSALPIVGPLFALIWMPIVLTYGFMNAHETDGWRAFVAALLPMTLVLCCLGFVLAANWDTIATMFQEAVERQRLNSGT